ncbi:hypothetical protein SNEBB_008395 [Seison nebaliae]|nr:hypothetical protein SNEBB_008395 [Seison nebaliae]
MDPKEQFVLIIQDLLSPTKVEEGTIQLKKFIEENEKNLLEIFMETIASQQIHEDVRTYAATLLVSNSSTLLASNNAPNLRLIGEQSLMFLYNAIYPNKIALKLCSWIERIYGRIINLKNKSKNKTNRQFHWNELKEKITKELERIVQGAEVMIPVNDFNKYSYLVSLEMLIILISKDGEYLNQQETNRFMKIILHFVQLNEANQLELLFTNSSCKALAILLLRLAPYHKNQETDEMIEVSIKLALNSLARYLSIDKINRTTDMKFDGIFDYFDSFLEDGKNLFHFLQQILIHLCQLIDNVAIVCDSHLRERSLQFLTDTVHNCLPQLATNPQLLSSIIQSSFHIMSCPWSMAEADKYLQEPKSISVMSDMNESIGIRMSARMLLDAIVENLTPKLFFDNFIPLLNKASGNFLQLTFEKEDDPNETFSFLKKVKENEKFPEHIEMLQRLPSETHTALLLSMATTCRCGGELIRKYFYSQFVRFGLLSTIIDNPLIQSASFILLGEILDNVYQESYFVEMTSVCLPMICRHITNQMGSIETGMMGDHIDEDNDEETMKKHDVIWKSFYLFNILMTNLKGIPSILIDNSIELLCQFIRHPTGEIKHKIFAFNSIETIFFNSTSMNLINIDHVERLLSTITPIMYVPLTEFTEVDIDIDAEKYSKHLLQMKSYDVFYAIIENWKSRLYLNEICSDEKLKKNYGYLSGKNLQEIIVYTFQLLEKIDQLRDNGDQC